MKNQIKELRIEIDGLAQLTKELKPIFIEYIGEREGYQDNSNEIKESHKSLLLAKCWLGKVLQELGEETPYKNDGNRKTVDDIEPVADTHTVLEQNKKENRFGKSVINLNNESVRWEELNHIEKVDFLRQEIKNIIDKYKNINNTLSVYYEEEFNKLEIKECEILKSGGKFDLSEEACKLPNFELELQFVYKYLSEARFYLGFELQRLKESNNDRN
jgi:hypothetical protein